MLPNSIPVLEDDLELGALVGNQLMFLAVYAFFERYPEAALAIRSKRVLFNSQQQLGGLEQVDGDGFASRCILTRTVGHGRRLTPVALFSIRRHLFSRALLQQPFPWVSTF